GHARDQPDSHQCQGAVIDEHGDGFLPDDAQNIHRETPRPMLLPLFASIRVKASEMAMKKTKIPKSAKSSPGQATPSPSPVQNTPNVVSMRPTTYFSVFSGTLESGRCTARPTASTAMKAASAPSAA